MCGRLVPWGQSFDPCPERDQEGAEFCRVSASVSRPSLSNFSWALATKKLRLVHRHHVGKDAHLARRQLAARTVPSTRTAAHQRERFSVERRVGRSRGPVDRVLQYARDRELYSGEQMIRHRPRQYPPGRLHGLRRTGLIKVVVAAAECRADRVAATTSPLASLPKTAQQQRLSEPLRKLPQIPTPGSA